MALKFNIIWKQFYEFFTNSSVAFRQNTFALLNITINIYLSSRQATALATRASSVARSLKLKATSTPVSTWMDDHQGTLDAVSRCPFVDVDLNL